MIFRPIFRFAKKRVVPINCRTPSRESTQLTRREKLEWVAFIAILTIVPVGFQVWQFDATSATRVNKAVMDELGRRDQHDQSSTVVDRKIHKNELTL